MGFLDAFKKKDDFDDLLKEPEGNNWGKEGDFNSDPGNDPLLGQDYGTDPLGSSGDAMGMSSSDPLGSTGGVMGLPSQSADAGFGMESDVPRFDDNSFSSNNTSASALNLNTNYPSSPNPSLNNNQNYGNHQQNMERPVTHGALSTNNQELDLIITKLDLLKSTLQNLDNRLYHIEKKIFDEPYNKNQW